MKASALWHMSRDTSALVEQELEKKGKDQLLVESHYSLVSLGTERQVASGLIPDSIWENMKVPYMEGTFALPCKYGYSLTGKVLKGPAAFAGKMVHVMHPHQDLLWVNPEDVFLVPENIPPLRAVLASQMETVVNVLWDSEISVGDRVLVAGYGMIGALVACVASGIPGVSVVVMEKNEFRSEMARNMGFELSPGCGKDNEIFDVAVHTASDAGSLQFCIDHVADEGQVTEVSFYGKKPVTFLAGGTFHTGRKKIVASQVSRVPFKKSPRWDLRRRKELAFGLLKDEKFDLFTDHVVPFLSSPLIFDKVRYRLFNELSVVFSYKD
jgi:threonine dehydrogenase-like Zn-dependent dehydrogenase